MRSPPLIALLLLAPVGLRPARGDTQRASATESYRGRVLHDVRLVSEGGSFPEASRALVELQPGDSYRPEEVRRSIRQLFALGAFSDIKVEAEPVGDAVDVVFRLYPRLEVDAVELEGLEPDLRGLTKRLEEESQIRVGSPLDVEELARGAERIQDSLREEGYLWASVEPEASFQSPSAAVVFHVESGPRARVTDVVIEGVPPRIRAHVAREIGLEPGDDYSRRELDRRIDSLTGGWKERGYYGASVEVAQEPGPPGSVALKLLPQLGPRIEIELEGWDLSDKELRELVPIFEEARFTPDLVEEGRSNIEARLRESGHRDARVTVERRATGSRQLVLRFVAEPGTRYKVAGVDFEGLESFPEAELSALLLSHAGGRLRGAPFRQEVWEDDLREVGAYLRHEGYHEVQIDGFARASLEDPSSLTLVVLVEEGPRAFVEGVEVQGASGVGAKRLLDEAAIEPGEPFDAAEVVAARERVVSLYRDEGFRQASVESETRFEDEGRLATVVFRVREGPRTRVDRVIISGLEVTRESTLERLVTLEPGEPLSSRELMETRQRLVGSGLFRSVDIEPLPMDPLTLRSDVLITVEEGPRTTFAYGFGYQEQQLARAEVEVTRRNLLGQNRTMSLFTRASFRGGRFITTYRQPDTFGLDAPLFVSAFAEQEQRTSFEYNRLGIGLQVAKRIDADQSLLFRYRFDRTKVFNLDVDIEEIDRQFRNVRISAVSVASLFDGRDDPLNPASGQFRILDVEWSATALGTEAPYVKALAQQFFYVPLPHDVVAAVGLRLGIGKTFRSDRDALMPIAERFFAGGATTLRGFALDEASPKRKIQLPDGETVDGEPLGGNVLSIVNLELRFPIFRNLRGVVFSDSGNVYRRLDVIELLNWRYNLGFGFRYDTPLGPLRVDYGFKLDRRTVRSIDCPDPSVACRESFGRWHVSLGHAF